MDKRQNNNHGCVNCGEPTETSADRCDECGNQNREAFDRSYKMK